MVTGHILGRMEESILEIIKTTRKVDLANTFGMMGEFFKDIGLMAREMEMEKLFILMAQSEKENGKTIKGKRKANKKN